MERLQGVGAGGAFRADGPVGPVAVETSRVPARLALPAAFAAALLGSAALPLLEPAPALAGTVVELPPAPGGQEDASSDVTAGEKGDEDTPDPANPTVDPQTLEPVDPNELLEGDEVAEAGPPTPEEPETAVSPPTPDVPDPVAPPAPEDPAPVAPPAAAQRATPPPVAPVVAAQASKATAEGRAASSAAGASSARRHQRARDDTRRQAIARAELHAGQPHDRREAGGDAGEAAPATRPWPLRTQSTSMPTRPARPAAARAATQGGGATDRPTSPGRRRHVVAPGESLWAIAAALAGPGADDGEIAELVAELWRMNRSTIGSADPGELAAGIALTLPRTDR